MLNLKTTMGYGKVDYLKENENYMLLEVTGQEIEAQKRPDISVVALLDVSGSMNGEHKIGYLKKSVIKLIDNLSASDRLSLITYSTTINRVFALDNMTPENKKRAIDIVNNLTTWDMTNMSEAIITGFEEFRTSVKEEGINRIILFTDGCPTSGNCNEQFLIELMDKKPEGVQVTTMGYGTPNENSFYRTMDINVNLLEKMSDRGKGNFYYMSDPDTCGRAFANELAGLLTVVAQNVKIAVRPANSHMEIVEVMDDVTVDDENGDAVITIPDILAGETKYILLKVKTSKQDKAWARPGTIANITVNYLDAVNAKAAEVLGKAKIEFVKKGVTKEMNPDVKTQLAVIEAIKAQEKAYNLASQGDYTGATNLVNSTMDFLRSTGTARGMSLGAAMTNTVNYMSNASEFTKNANVISAGLSSLKKGRASGGDYDAVYTTSAQNMMQDTWNQDGDVQSSTNVSASAVNATGSATVTSKILKTTKSNRF